MKAYLITTSVMFALITVAHIARMFVEATVVRDPWFLGLTVLAIGMCGWAIQLLRRRVA